MNSGDEFDRAFFVLRDRLLDAGDAGRPVLTALVKFFLCNYDSGAAGQVRNIEQAVYGK